MFCYAPHKQLHYTSEKTAKKKLNAENRADNLQVKCDEQEQKIDELRWIWSLDFWTEWSRGNLDVGNAFGYHSCMTTQIYSTNFVAAEALNKTAKNMADRTVELAFPDVSNIAFFKISKTILEGLGC